MTKVVINGCFGGFGLSPLATRRWAELNGRECHFFDGGLSKPYTPVDITTEDGRESLFWSAFDTADVSEANAWVARDRGDYDPAATEAFNDWYERHSINLRDIQRDNPQLLQIVEELGDKANGSCAELRVVEIPDGVEWCIEEYDGNEHVAEVHRTWS